MEKLLLTAAVAGLVQMTGAAQAPTGDHDDQLVVTGCVTPSGDVRGAGPHSLFLWSRGDVHLTFPDVRFRPSETARPVGTVGGFVPVVYWIDDEDDFAGHVGSRVEIVGEIDDEFENGELEIDHEGDVTEITFEVDGRGAKARIPTAWLGPQTRGRDVEFDVLVRTVDVEKVTVLGRCGGR